MSTTAHWQDRWSSNEHDELGWYQTEPEPSLGLVTARTPAGGHVLDVGGGASQLVDRLLERGHRVTVLDLAEAALDVARRRLGPVRRQDEEDLAALLGDGFELREQCFTFTVFARVA